jgi:hypothetical protein
MRNLPRINGLILCVCLGWAAQARADVVVDWNAIASGTVFSAVPARPGPTGILDLAMVHVAMHDAIQAFEGRFEPYAGSILNASGSPIAAAAQAAHDVLAARFPPQAGSLDTLLSNYLNSLGLSGDAWSGHRSPGGYGYSRPAKRRRELPFEPRSLRWRYWTRGVASDASSLRADGIALVGDCRSLHPQGFYATHGVAPSAALEQRRIRPSV